MHAAKNEIAQHEAANAASSQKQTHALNYYLPRTDVVETDKYFSVFLDMPGVAKDQIEVRLEKNELIVEGKAKSPDNGGLKLVYSEYETGSFSRRFTLSSDLNLNKIEASLEAGVLRLKVPKRPETKTKTIKLI